MQKEKPHKPSKVPKPLGGGCQIDLPDGRHVAGWLCAGKEMLFQFKNGDKVVHIRLSDEAVQALIRVINRAPAYATMRASATPEDEYIQCA